MASDRRIPDDPLHFIQKCIEEQRVLWTYHVNMRVRHRAVRRSVVFDAVSAYEIIESYPDDKYLPSYLVYFNYDGSVYHVLFATDTEHGNVRVITVYRPEPRQWSSDLKRRQEP